jgi:hypothetical protein
VSVFWIGLERGTQPPTTREQYRQKAREARQLIERSADPDVRQMWRDIAEQYEYLAEHVQQRDWQWSGLP